MPLAECQRLLKGKGRSKPTPEMAAFLLSWIACHRAGGEARSCGHLVQLFDGHHEALTSLQKALSSSSGAWLLPVLGFVMRRARQCAVSADQAISAARPQPGASSGSSSSLGDAEELGAKADKCEELARTLNQLFNTCLADRAADGKMLGCLDIINNLFKIYFKMSNLRMIPSLLRTVASKGFPSLDSFPISHLVTYKFYLGRLELLQGNYPAADQSLSFAFERCTVRSPVNKRLCLLFLVPVRLMLGKLPRRELLRKYQLPLYQALTDVIRAGDIRAFTELVERHQDVFISRGTFILINKLRYVVLRVFLSRVAVISKASTGHCIVPGCKFTKTGPHLHLSVLQQLLKDIDIPEIECIIVNLISRKLVRGYLSHQAGILVMSKGRAFPPISQMLLL